jgi:hypothetical protein
MRRLLRTIGWVLLSLQLAVPATSQTPAKVELEVTVAQISDGEGPIDPRGQQIHEKLKREYRYGSLKVVESRKLRLGLNEVGQLELPNGKKLQIVPMLLDDRGVLMAVDLEGVLKTDLRVKSGHLVVFGAHRHGSDKLVVAVTPRL